MDQALVMEFLKEIAVGFKSAKSYPPGHPVMDKVVDNTMAQLAKLYTELPEFSMYFLEQTIIFQDLQLDMAKNPAIRSLLDALRKVEIHSLTFTSGVTNEDMKNLYEVISSPKLKIKEYGDAATMLNSKGTEKIKINAVKFGVQTGGAVQVAAAETKAPKKPTELIAAIRNLKDLIEKGITGPDIKNKFDEVTEDIEGAPKDSWHPYSEAVAKIIEKLPSEHRIELLREAELRPFILKLFSNLSDETLIKLIITRAEQKKEGDLKNILNVLGEDKFAEIMPELKEKIPNIYEYLAKVGILLSEKMTSTVSKEDLRISIRPYYSMLDSQNAHIREEGLRSLITLAKRFIDQGSYELANEIISRISVSIREESVNEVVSRLIDDLSGLYQTSKTHNQDKICSLILDPFSKILGRGGLSIGFKKKTINFLGETGNRVVLPMLFSFLWESGIYPDVRSAILEFGKDAVSEVLLTLKEAEEPSLRTKLVDILKNIGAESVEILIDNLDVADWFLRRNIIAVLGEIGDKRVVDRLVPLLEDEDDRVRLELVKTFTKLEYEDGFLKALDDISIEVKSETLKGLRKKISMEKAKDLLPLFKEKGDTIHIELLKIVGEKRILEAADWIAEFLRALEGRDDPVAQELKEMGVMTLIKLNVSTIKTILESFKPSKDKKLAHLATAALKRIA